jgi:hypothetical protein
VVLESEGTGAARSRSRSRRTRTATSLARVPAGRSTTQTTSSPTSTPTTGPLPPAPRHGDERTSASFHDSPPSPAIRVASKLVMYEASLGRQGAAHGRRQPERSGPALRRGARHRGQGGLHAAAGARPAGRPRGRPCDGEGRPRDQPRDWSRAGGAGRVRRNPLLGRSGPPPPLRAPLPRPLLQSQRAESANTHAHNTHTTRTHKQTHTQTNTHTHTHTHTHTPPPAPSCNLTSARAPGGGGALPQGRAVRRGASLELRRRARPPARQSGEFRPARFDQF